MRQNALLCGINGLTYDTILEWTKTRAFEMTKLPVNAAQMMFTAFNRVN